VLGTIGASHSGTKQQRFAARVSAWEKGLAHRDRLRAAPQQETLNTLSAGT